MNRRKFLHSSLVATTALAASRLTAAPAGRRPRILLRNGWQSVNIGDIGHTPGALRLIEEHFPEADVTLWPNEIERGAQEMLVRAFPKLKIVRGAVGADGKPTTPELATAWAEADLYLSGSGHGFPAHAQAAAFHRLTGKPMGVFAVSTDPISWFGPGRDPEGGTLDDLRRRIVALPPGHLTGDLRYAIENAAFMFCRDTISLAYLKAQGVKTRILEFGPDSQLGMHLRDDAKGLAYLRDHQLEEGKFICVIPRLRYTPYYLMRKTEPKEEDRQRAAINKRTTEKDLSRVRDMMIRYVRATGGKVMTCPEVTYQIDTAKEFLVDPLPADVKKNVVWRDTYWLPDEAASIYAKALAVVSVDCHSPLIAYHNGTPSIYVRNPTDTCKGEMYRDFGAGRWVVEIEEMDGAQLWGRLKEIVDDPARARAKVAEIMTFVRARQKRMMEVVRATAGS